MCWGRAGACFLRSCVRVLVRLRRFVVKPWSPLCHSVYPRSFRDTVMTVLKANAREDSLPAVLPPALWMEVRRVAWRGVACFVVVLRSNFTHDKEKELS